MKSDSAKIVCFDIGNTSHVKKLGPHLNIETYSKSFGTVDNKPLINLHVFWRK